MDMRFAADKLESQAQRFAAFTGITQPRPTDKFFLVMGMTGSGKSTFVGRCTGKDVTVGHGLYSCTDSIDVFDFQLRNRRVYLIDTPGFNDTNRSDIDTLNIMATYLGASYANGVRIHGIIMLHPISDNRMSGSSMRNLEMLKAMCGFSSYHNLTIATTMWPESPSSSDAAFLKKRQNELLSDPRFFGALVGQGATVSRHNQKGRRDASKEKASAQHIVAHLIQQSETYSIEVLSLQHEMIDEGKALGETEAGIAVAGDLYKLRQAHERELQKLEANLKAELTKKSSQHVADLQELKDDLEARLSKMEQDKHTLENSIQDMHRKEERAFKRRLKALEKKFSDDLAAKEQELLDMEESLEEIRKDMKRRAKRSPATQQSAALEIQKYEKEVDNVREEVSEARESYKESTGKTRDISNGVTREIASGLAAGAISGVLAGGMLCAVM